MTRVKNAFKRGIERLMVTANAQHKAKKLSRTDLKKISSAKRNKKWKEISVKAIKEYHAWAIKELKKLGYEVD